MAIDASGISSAAGLFGTAVSDLFSSTGDQINAQGDLASATSYGQAATIAQQNEQITQQEFDVKQAQLDRTIYKTISGQEAQVAGAGFKESGSALDILRDSSAQGALSKALVTSQGIIQENAFAEQAGAYSAMADAAKSAASATSSASTGAEIAGGISAVAGVASVANSIFPGAIGEAASAVGDFITGLF